MRWPLLVLSALAMGQASGSAWSGAAEAGHAPAGAVEAQSPAEAPDAPTNLKVLTQFGAQLTFSWTPPTSGTVPTSYVLEGGVAPGEVLASVPIDGDARTLTIEAPTGAFFVRLHALAGTSRSAASNEIPVFVNVPHPPSAPAHLLGLVVGDTVTLSWTNSFTGGEPTQLWLEVSGALSLLVPLPVGETFTYRGVPAGAYAMRLFASNAGGMSAASNTVDLAFPSACSGQPGAATNFRTWTEDGQLFVTWDPPANGAATTSYAVQVSGGLQGRVETTARALSGVLPPGAYAVSVVARNACGDGPAAPAAPDWTAVIRRGDTHLVQWAPTPGATGYRVYWARDRRSLEPLDATATFVDSTDASVTLPVGDGQPVYYRVYERYDTVAGSGGPVATSTNFSVVEVPSSPESPNFAAITPALWDFDGDGCLDRVGATGGCDGTFRQYPLAGAGLGGLFAPGRENRDSRVADFTGDGIADIFTNVYSRADNPASSSILHVGDGHGRYTEAPGLAAMHVGGYGETVLAADFDNDGDLDIFNPVYTHVGDGGHNWLLINDGAGHFTDIAAAAGVATNVHFPPEGAQALDVNEDGWIDIVVASQVFINNGNLTFTDQAAVYHLPMAFDEGMRLFDVDLDGDFDLVHHDGYVTRLYHNVDGRFDDGLAVNGDPELADTMGYGLNVCDVNGDGFQDLLLANNSTADFTGAPLLLVNTGGVLQRSDFVPDSAAYNDLLACADLDRSGLPDVVTRWNGYRSLMNQAAAGPVIRVRVVGARGERNQQGRVVRVRPLGAGGRTMLRVVEAGSGYMAQNDYDLLIGAPWAGPYEISVRVAGGWVQATAAPGDSLTIAADGVVTPGLR